MRNNDLMEIINFSSNTGCSQLDGRPSDTSSNQSSEQKPLMFDCQNCSSLFSDQEHCAKHEKQCKNNKDIQLDDLMCTVSNQSDDYFCVNESQVVESTELDQNEEYLEEDEEIEEDSNCEEEPEEIVTFEYDVKTYESKPFTCAHCEKTFISRSGRDTHQQLKHKVPNEFHDEFTDINSHELEVELENGALMRAWKCPSCDLVSKRKNHHITHLIRHAIRKNDEVLQEVAKHEKSNLVISKSETLLEEPSTELIDVEPAPQTQSFNLGKKPLNIPRTTYAVTVGGEFSCSECKSKFKDEEAVKTHVQKFGNTGLCTQLACTECNVVFLTENSLRRHQSHHLLAVIADALTFFECSVCSVVFGSQKDLDKHNLLHNDVYVFEPETSTKLEGCEALVYDLNLEWNRLDLHCAYCARFGSKSEMNLHIALFHGNLVCPIDRQEFGRGLSYFVNHMKIKHPELFGEVSLTFTCPHCKTAEFQQKELMMKHSLTCHAKGFSCYHCPKKFALERQLKHHLASVNGIKNHKCPECEKSFTSRTELNVHTRSHTKDKPYCCTFPDCNKSFRTNSHRSSHMYTHNPDKKFQCKVCSSTFQTPGARRIHEKTHAATKNICGICSKEFSQRSHYVRHVNDQHRIQCNSSNLEERIRNFNQSH